MEIKYNSNLWAGIVSIIMGLVCFFIIPGQIAEDYAVTYGITSRTVPYAIAVLWIVCGMALMIQGAIFKKDEKKTLVVAKEGKAAAYMLVLLIYAVLFQKSFLFSTMFLGVATLAFTGSRKKMYYVIVLITVVVLYVLFAKVLHVQMP